MQIIIKSGIGPITVINYTLGFAGLLMVMGHGLMVNGHSLVLSGD